MHNPPGCGWRNDARRAKKRKIRSLAQLRTHWKQSAIRTCGVPADDILESARAGDCLLLLVQGRMLVRRAHLEMPDLN
ncbi:hypothetical protein ACFV2V_32110 [Streptomyces sp. NPDC059698]|uniref:hypothetical protein n=1 Tax=Streptomyces TaxID=1883 RepID=UPI001161243A|nr:hypothetical protein [Streptomyces sp. CB02366]